MPICTNVSLKVYLCIWKCIFLLECVPVYPKVYMCIWKYGGVPKSANVDRYMYHQQSIVAVMRQSLGPVNGQLWSKNGNAWHVPPLSTNMSHRPHWTTHQLVQAASGVSVEKCRDIRLFNICVTELFCELTGLLKWVLDIYNGCLGLFRGLWVFLALQGFEGAFQEYSLKAFGALGVTNSFPCPAIAWDT